MTAEILAWACRKVANTPAHKREALIAKCQEITARPVCEANTRYEALAILTAFRLAEKA